MKPAPGRRGIADLRIEKNLVDIPLYGYPIQGVNESGNRLIVPGVEQFVWMRGHGANQLTNWYPRSAPYVLQLSEVGPTLDVDGDLRKLPFKTMAIDYSDRVVSGQRLVLVEAESRHLTAGKTLHVRIRALDTRLPSAAESALKTPAKDLAKATHDVAATAKKQADAEAALKANVALIASKTKELENPKTRDDVKKRIEADLPALKAKSTDLATEIAAATAEAEPFNKTIAALTPVVADLKKKVDAVADANPLADAAVFAQIRSYDGGQWIDVPAAPAGAAREFNLAVPSVPDGIYRLKVGVKGDDIAHPPIAAESWVTIASERPYSIGLFTNRGRDSFYRGEGFWLGVGLLNVKEKIPAGTAVSVELVDAANKRLPIFQQQTAGPDRSAADVRHPARSANLPFHRGGTLSRGSESGFCFGAAAGDRHPRSRAAQPFHELAESQVQHDGQGLRPHPRIRRRRRAIRAMDRKSGL